MAGMLRYAAIDLETTGIDPENAQILEVGCVVETDWVTPVEHLPTLRLLVRPEDGMVYGHPRALAMNARLIAELADAPKPPAKQPPTETQAVYALRQFLAEHLGRNGWTLGGKNFGSFDLQFLRRHETWNPLQHKQRFLDPAPLWFRPAEDACLPDLPTCLARAGVPAGAAHDAVEDCRAVVRLVRAAFAGKAGAA